MSSSERRETERLAALDYLHAVRPEADEVLQQLVDAVREVFETDLCMVSLVLSDVQYFRAWSGDLHEDLAEARYSRTQHVRVRGRNRKAAPRGGLPRHRKVQGSALLRQLRHPLLRGDSTSHFRWAYDRHRLAGRHPTQGDQRRADDVGRGVREGGGRTSRATWRPKARAGR